MKPGPHVKPTALKKLTGNPGGRKLPTNEPQPDKSMPRCPRHLSGEAKKEWKKIAKRLHEVGLLSYVDGNMLAIYCQAYAHWIFAQQQLALHGLVQTTPQGYQAKSVWLTISDKALDQILKVSREFGLTPSSRATLSVGEDGPTWSIADELMAAVAEGKARAGGIA